MSLRPTQGGVLGNRLLARLGGGDRRSIGRSNAVAATVRKNPHLFGVLIRGMLSDDPLVRMRAADAVEKITVARPEYLAPYRSLILAKVARIEQQEIRWHVAQLIPRLALTPPERRKAVGLMWEYLADDSRIVRTFAMQALADLSDADPALRREILPLLRKSTRTGSPAMRARGRKLLKRLEVRK